jgi:hypothetical protein
VFGLLALLWASSAFAQAKQIMVGERIVQCTSMGIPVLWVENNSIGDGGQTSPNFLVITYSSDVLRRWPVSVELWAMGHECGHAYNRTGNEERADCWSIITGIQQNWFTEEDFPELEKLFKGNKGDLHHPPGDERIAHMKTCMDFALRTKESNGGSTGLRNPVHVAGAPYFKSDPEATDCGEDVFKHTALHWHKNPSNGTVDYKLKYKNKCGKPIVCLIRVAVGNEESDGWRITHQEFSKVPIPPHKTVRVKGDLFWKWNDNGTKSTKHFEHSTAEGIDDWGMACKFSP